ncbi:MAG TPA: hypothetical protein VGJ73_06530 [Verrucomicrobiae bacterium]|jgi:hypothetical protein
MKNQISTIRYFVFGVVLILIAFGVGVKIKRIHTAAEFEKGIMRFEARKNEDNRFTNAYVSYFPDPPSVIVLAYGLPRSAKNSLVSLIATNFFPLQVRIIYKDEPVNTNQ